ncbi:MAG: hypothetical protein QOC94_1919 [Actinoplanes sp.]|nr:hypothetical protein [Actinoplanes sp.]
MNFSSAKRPLLLGLALSLTGAAGAAAAVTPAVAGPSAPQNAPVAPAGRVSPAGTALSIAAATATSASPVATAAPPTVISVGQARGIAERAGNGRADKIEAEAGATGISYDVSVIRSDGTDVDLIIDGHTGRILTTFVEPPDPQDSNAPEPQDGSD